jgi:transposase
MKRVLKVNGNRHWFWAWQSTKLTYITHAANRKVETIKTHYPKGFPHSTLAHDGWKLQINTPTKNHQSCLAHLQRRLNYLNEKYSNASWGIQFLKLLYHAMRVKKKNPERTQYTIEKAKIIQQLNHLLSNPPDKTDKEHLFTFLFIEQIPSGNNATERAIRNVKVKQKISGQFKKEDAAQNFAKIRSVIYTTIKNSMNVLNSLTLIAKFEIQN